MNFLLLSILTRNQFGQQQNQPYNYTNETNKQAHVKIQHIYKRPNKPQEN